MYLNTYRFNIDPSGGTLDEKIEDAGSYDSYFISNSDFDTEVVSGYELVTSPELRLRVHFNPNSGTVAKSGNVMFEISHCNYWYEESDVDHENPIPIDEGSEIINFEYVQSIYVEEIEVPTYDPDNPGTPPLDFEIIQSQNELNEDGILSQSNILDMKKALLVESNKLKKENDRVKDSAESDLRKIAKLEDKLAKYRAEYNEESPKDNPNRSKLANLSEKCLDIREKISYIKSSLDKLLENTGDDYNPDINYEMRIESYFDTSNPSTVPYSEYINKRYKDLESSTVGIELDNEYNKFNRYFDYLQQFVPKLVESMATASFEPMTAVVITPVGAGSVAGNPLQTSGTIKRVTGQVLDLYPSILDLLNQCRVLKLPDNIFKSVAKLVKVIKPLSKLIPSV